MPRFSLPARTADFLAVQAEAQRGAGDAKEGKQAMHWHRSWSVLAVAMLFQAVTFGIGIYSFTFWVVPWSAEFAVGRSDVMTVYMTMLVCMGLFSPLAGRAMDRLSIRGLIIAGALCLALGLALAGRVAALWHLNLIYGTLMVAGLVLAGPMAGQTLAARWFSRRRGVALGVVTIGTSIGGLTVPLLVTTLHAELGWRPTNDVLAVLVLVVIVPLVWWLVDDGRAPAADIGQADAAPGGTQPSPSSLTTLDVLRQRVFWLTVLVITPVATAFGGAQQNLAPYAADLGFDAEAASYLVSVMALVMIGAKIFFGAMADQWDLRFLLGLAIGGLAIAFGCMLTPLSYPMLVLVCGLLGFVAGGFLPLMGAIVSQNFDIRAFGQVMGMLGPFTTLAASGPWIAGYLRDTTGSYDPAWVALGILLIPSAIAAALMPGRRQRL